MLSNLTDKISIIIPAYNIAEYLPRCLDSILAQTYENIELIVVNDGSKDNTEAVIKEYAQKDNRVRLISKVNEGVTKARLTGVEVATGEWIGFVDGDDFIEKDMYEVLLSNAKRYNAEISHCGYQMVFPSRVDYYYNTGKLVEQDNKAGVADLLKGDFVEPGLVNKLFNKRLLDKLLADGLIDSSIKINEDLLMNYYLFKLADKSVYNDKCFYHYMLREGSAATSKVNENKLKDPLKVLKIIRDDCDKIYDLKEVLNARICARLINILTMSSKLNPELIVPYKKTAKKEIRKLMPVILKGKYSLKRKVFVLWASVWPWSYRAIHIVYAKITGSDKKYEVK